MKKISFLILTSLIVACLTVYGKQKSKEDNMKIRLIINNTEFTATMYDNPTAQDFISLLPLTLKLEDYAGTEKISKLPEKLSLQDAPSGSDPSVGDITYYSPWGNLAIFYRDFSYAKGLIVLGTIDSGADFFKNCKDSCTIKIEKVTVNK